MYKGSAGHGNPNWLGGRELPPPNELKPRLSNYRITKSDFVPGNTPVGRPVSGR